MSLNENPAPKRESFTSRLGFLLVSAGCAIGIGNVWKFPYIAGQGGGLPQIGRAAVFCAGMEVSCEFLKS